MTVEIQNAFLAYTQKVNADLNVYAKMLHSEVDAFEGLCLSRPVQDTARRLTSGLYKLECLRVAFFSDGLPVSVSARHVSQALLALNNCDIVWEVYAKVAGTEGNFLQGRDTCLHVTGQADRQRLYRELKTALRLCVCPASTRPSVQACYLEGRQ